MRENTNGPFNPDCPELMAAAEASLAAELAQQREPDPASVNDLRVFIAKKLTPNKSGKPLGTVSNYERVLAEDPAFTDLRYNTLAHRYEKLRNGKAAVWQDTDDAEAIVLIARAYGFESQKAFPVAMDARQRAISYHPLQQLVQSLKWDGRPRITDFLRKWTGAPDSPYLREVSRLLFAGGIHRLFRPGCKFDETIVLTGAQGSGKSTLVRWLALRDEYFAELLTVDGKQGAETLEGKWICELSELLAMKSAKAVESVKSFLSRTVDTFRPAYGHRVADFPRSCIIIGTSNNDKFIGDATGGRRFYPVPMTVTAEWLYGHEAECKAEIAQCWAEAYACFASSDPAIQAYVQPFPYSEIRDEIRARQAEAAEEDVRVGQIQSWLDSCCTADEVCVLMIWRHALNQQGAGGSDSIPSKRDTNEIAQILDHIEGWERGAHPHTFPVYGRQRYWRRVKNA